MSPSLNIKEMQIKIIVRHNYMPIRKSKIKKKQLQQMLARMQINCNSHLLLVGLQMSTTSSENGWAVSQKVEYTPIS
jgi:hypothetical protein